MPTSTYQPPSLEDPLHRNCNNNKGNDDDVEESSPFLLSPKGQLRKPYLLVMSATQAAETMFFGVVPQLRHHTWLFRLILAFLFLAIVVSFSWSLVSCSMWTYRHASCYQVAEPTWVLPKTLPRPCPGAPSAWIDNELHHSANSTFATTPRVRICMASLTDAPASSSWFTRPFLRCRNFDRLATLVGPNHARYADLHGYQYTLAKQMDRSRPPAWSKIKVVLDQLDRTTMTQSGDESGANSNAVSAACDWVVWMDADVVIRNTTLRWESLLVPTSADLLVTPDATFGVSSGVFAIRNTEWSRQFLHQWWDSTSFVRAKGLSLSGDNAAFGSLVEKKRKIPGEAEHIAVTEARCVMNSNAVFVEPSKPEHNVASRQKDWRGSISSYHSGDFLAHAAGVDDKARAIALLLDEPI